MAVNKLEDRFGNYYTVTYFENADATNNVEFRPTQLRYTGQNGGQSPYARIDCNTRT